MIRTCRRGLLFLPLPIPFALSLVEGLLTRGARSLRRAHRERESGNGDYPTEEAKPYKRVDSHRRGACSDGQPRATRHPLPSPCYSVRPELGRRALNSEQDRFDELSANGEWAYIVPGLLRISACSASPRDYFWACVTSRAVGLISRRNKIISRRRSGDGADQNWIGLTPALRTLRLRESSPSPSSSPVFRYSRISSFPHSRLPIPASVTQPRLFPFRRPEMCLFARRQGKISAPRLASTRQTEAHTYI